MDRPITGFHRDDEEHWVAELSCGHAQHVRHDPPFTERSWVLDEAERTARIGQALDCLRCDRRELPKGFAPYRRTPTFDERSVPAALTRAHTTKAGVWGLIHVESGRLVYVIEPPFDRREVIEAGAPGVVLPEIPHRVTPLGEVTFAVEFWRAGVS